MSHYHMLSVEILKGSNTLQSALILCSDSAFLPLNRLCIPIYCQLRARRALH